MFVVSITTKPVSLIKHLLLSPVLAYLALTAGYLLMRVVGWSPMMLHETASSFIHFWLLLSAPLLLLTLPLRAWQLTAGLAVPGLLFWLFFGALFLPQRTPTCTVDCTEFTIMTINTSPIAPGESVVEAFRQADADIIVIQELQLAQANLIEQELQDPYPHQALYPSAGLDGIGILSKYPISDDEIFHLVVGRFPYIIADIDIEGEHFTVIGAHPPPPMIRPYQSRLSPDLADLLEIVEGEERVVLLGDFNTTDQHRDYQALRRSGLNDAWRSVGSGFGLSFPIYGRYGGLPIPVMVRIDHIFYTDDFTALDAWIGPDVGADHRAVVARLVLQETMP